MYTRVIFYRAVKVKKENVRRKKKEAACVEKGDARACESKGPERE